MNVISLLVGHRLTSFPNGQGLKLLFEVLFEVNEVKLLQYQSSHHSVVT